MEDVGAKNRRHLAALYCGATSGFEVNSIALSFLVCLFENLVVNKLVQMVQ